MPGHLAASKGWINKELGPNQYPAKSARSTLLARSVVTIADAAHKTRGLLMPSLSPGQWHGLRSPHLLTHWQALFTAIAGTTVEQALVSF
jgi:hypothetical protein